MKVPKLLSKIWAEKGLKNDIPAARSDSLPNESATYEDGFPSITMTPIAMGGKAPSGKDMNGILNELSAHTVFQNKGGIYKFDAAFAQKIGGYDKGAVLINDNLDRCFISLVDKNKTNFNTADFKGKWQVISGVDFFVPKTQEATLKEKGITKLFSGVNSDSEEMAATPKAVKTAFDRAVTAETNNAFQKIYIPNETLSLDLTNRQQIINLFGDKYRQNGYLTFANHNNAKSNITGLPLETRSPIVMTFYMMNGYSIFYCHYVSLNRKFFSVANLNNATYKLNWIEDITNTGEQTINNQLVLATSGWSKIKFPIDNGGEWRFEVNPNSETDPRFNVVYKMLNGTTRYCSFPVLGKNEVVAYRSWVDSQIANNFTRSKLTTQNLNDVKVYGVYAQEENREATTERNYPTNFAGTLIVYPSAYNVMQKYINFRTGETYQRNQNIDLRTWSEWKRVDGLGKVDESAISHAINGTNKAKVASEFALGELFKTVVTDIRLGAATRHQLWRNKGFAGNLAGHVVTGVVNDGNDDPDYVLARPIQKKINEQWVTISNA